MSAEYIDAMGIPPGTMCQRCRVHVATVVHADSVIDWAHGHSLSWCECCQIRDSIRQAEEAADRLPYLRADLTIACQDQPPADPYALLIEAEQLRFEAERQWLTAHCVICGKHYPGQDAMNYAHPHPEGEHCYWPKPGILGP